MPTTEIWGIADRTGRKLNAMGIHTVNDLRDADLKLIRKKISVVLQRTVMGLRGVPCIESTRISSSTRGRSRGSSGPSRR